MVSSFSQYGFVMNLIAGLTKNQKVTGHIYSELFPSVFITIITYCFAIDDKIGKLGTVFEAFINY